MTNEAEGSPYLRNTKYKVLPLDASGMPPSQFDTLRQVVRAVGETAFLSTEVKTTGVIVAGPAARLAGLPAAKCFMR
jgi:hypothetical protein